MLQLPFGMEVDTMPNCLHLTARFGGTLPDRKYCERPYCGDESSLTRPSYKISAAGTSPLPARYLQSVESHTQPSSISWFGQAVTFVGLSAAGLKDVNLGSQQAA